MGFTGDELLLLRRLRGAIAALSTALWHAGTPDAAAHRVRCSTWLIDIDKFLVLPPFCVGVEYPGLYRMLSRDVDKKRVVCQAASAACSVQAASGGVVCERWEDVACVCLELHAVIQHEV
jgi:hypothetical protein